MESNYYNNRYITDEKTNKSLLISPNKWYVNFSSLVISILLYYLFKTYTSNIYYYESTDCECLLKNFKSISMLYYYYAFITGLFFITGLLGVNLSGLKMCIQFSVTIITTVCLIVITSDLFKAEPCGKLFYLALIWVIYGWIEIVFLFGLSCCVICTLCAGFALASA